MAEKETHSPVYKAVSPLIRPAKVALLIDSSDRDWMDTCLRAIEWLSGLWGGAYCLLIPTDGKTISEPFWDILKLYDPDYIRYYERTGYDLKLTHPDKHKSAYEQFVGAWKAASPGASGQFIEQEFDRQFNTRPIGQFKIDIGLRELFYHKLSPFHYKER